MRRIALAFVGFTLLVVIGITAFGSSAPPAKADMPPGSVCLTPPAAPGGGSLGYLVSATLPTAAPTNASGVCVSFGAANANNNTAVIMLNPADCAGATPAALATPSVSGNYVSANWGDANCVRPGETVKIKFYSNSGLTAVPTIIWKLGAGTPTPGPTPTAQPTPVVGTGSVQAYSVGGIAEPPEDSAPLSVDTGSQGLPAPLYAVIAGMALLAIVVAGGWYVRRRRLG